MFDQLRFSSFLLTLLHFGKRQNRGVHTQEDPKQRKLSRPLDHFFLKGQQQKKTEREELRRCCFWAGIVRPSPPSRNTFCFKKCLLFSEWKRRRMLCQKRFQYSLHHSGNQKYEAPLLRVGAVREKSAIKKEIIFKLGKFKRPLFFFSLPILRATSSQCAPKEKS